MKILVVEDERILAQILSKSFNLLGHEVILAFNGEDGLRKAQTEPDIKLILLDLMLPIKDGFQVLKELKSDPKTKDIPVVITSNIAEEAKIKEGIEAGAADYLVKSNISIDNLTELVNKYVS
ncbi:MAG: response regulator receiver domain protein [candidate division CPR2 bacterium GW2011_GWC1_39_9]|uniref:Response regulator receiver n=1 Tax=candidate division CPR2 bacterium GW2011_GWC2_39_10 TaxID=1618345 RepID=A0A0G0LPP9_UNCC2|nr:MAG: Response regulator receiver [candidate division CPR2 bacterium GW2011_GWC2_39_10]KKR33858.1 MAG: response regulator receiver domain protein [candidate division CPR2 bacterium GW2011_GWC1_39_9]